MAPVLVPTEVGSQEQFLGRGVFVPDADGTLRTGFPAGLTVHPPRPPGPAPEMPTQT